MNQQLDRILKLLRGRPARNIYIWAIMLCTVFSLNHNNEAASHYGITTSPWYWPVMICSILLQAILLYGNNLVLVPRFLIRRNYTAYFTLMLLMTVSISLLYTFGLKVANRHLDVSHLQQVGFVSTPVDNDWSFRSLLFDAESYITGNLLWVFIFTMAWYMNDYSRQRRLAEAALRAQVETELAFLKNQLNPHFLFNTLNNLYALSLKKADDAPDTILKLSAILRYLLYESNAALVPFGKEREIMQAYIDLELLRLRDKEGLRFIISADNDRPIPPLLWLPVLENIFKHGTRMIGRDSFAVFHFELRGRQLLIDSRNSFKPAAARQEGPGIGLQNLRKRLELIFPGRYQFSSASLPHEYQTAITIDLSNT